MRGGRQVQAAAGGEVEAAGNRAGDDGRRRLSAQGILDRPQRVLVGLGLDDEEAADVEAELGKAVAVGPAEIHERALCGDEHGGAGAPVLGCRRQGEEEAERRWPIAVGRCGQLMQDAAGKARTGQVGLDLRYPEGEVLRFRPSGRLEPGKRLAQGGDAGRF